MPCLIFYAMLGLLVYRGCSRDQAYALSHTLPHAYCPCSRHACTQASMAELPTAKRARYLALGLPKADVLILADELATADFFDATMAAGAPAKAAANWIMGDIMAACKVHTPGCSMSYAQHRVLDFTIINCI